MNTKSLKTLKFGRKQWMCDNPGGLGSSLQIIV
jgi:hypothetical protein